MLYLTDRPTSILTQLSRLCTGKRRELEDEDADDGWAVEKSLTKHQARTYILSKQNKYRCVVWIGVIIRKAFLLSSLPPISFYNCAVFIQFRGLHCLLTHPIPSDGNNRARAGTYGTIRSSSSNRMVEMFVDKEKICFNPYGKTGLLSVKQRRPVRCKPVKRS